MITVNCTVNDGAGKVYKLNENTPEHLTYIALAIKVDVLQKDLQFLKQDCRYGMLAWDESHKAYNKKVDKIHDEISKLERELRKALGECFDEYKET